jgi:hypothetical protein
MSYRPRIGRYLEACWWLKSFFFFPFHLLVRKCSGDLGAVVGNKYKPKPVVGYKYAKGLARRRTHPGQDVFHFLIGA